MADIRPRIAEQHPRRQQLEPEPFGETSPNSELLVPSKTLAAGSNKHNENLFTCRFFGISRQGACNDSFRHDPSPKAIKKVIANLYLAAHFKVKSGTGLTHTAIEQTHMLIHYALCIKA